MTTANQASFASLSLKPEQTAYFNFTVSDDTWEAEVTLAILPSSGPARANIFIAADEFYSGSFWGAPFKPPYNVRGQIVQTIKLTKDALSKNAQERNRCTLTPTLIFALNFSLTGDANFGQLCYRGAVCSQCLCPDRNS